MKALIVDDEPEVAQRLARALAATGWGEAFSATNAEDAVALVNREGNIDVLATQVFLEGIDGFTLYETIRPHLPELRVIFFSEYDLQPHAERIGPWPVLARPVDSPALVAEIHRLVPIVRKSAPEAAAGDPLMGAMLGAYRIDALVGEDLDGKIYQAVQTTIGRSVEFHVLAPERAADPQEIDRFLANARAKANVHHPALLSVFEAGESDGYYFYTSEMRQGESLWHLSQQNEKLTSSVLLSLLHAVAEAMVHLGQMKIPHEPLHAGHIILDSRSRARLVNIATYEPMGNTARADMRNLAMALSPLVLPHPSSGALQQLLANMEAGAIPVRSWTALIYELKRCIAAGASPAYQLDAGGRAEIAAVGMARKRHRTRRLRLIGIIVLLLVALAAVAAWFLLDGRILPWKI